MELKKILNCKPLCFIDEETLLVFKKYNIYIYYISCDKFEYVCKIPTKLVRYTLSHIRLFERKYGLDSIQGIKIKGNNFLIWEHNRFYLLNLEDKKITLVSVKKYKILAMTQVKGNIYFGDYGYNPHKKEISIHKYNLKNNKIEKMYTFAESEINHVHNILYDNTRQRFYIFTGDYGQSAAIYLSDLNFKKVEVLYQGNQKYRACQGKIYDNFLFWVTDTPMEENYVMKMNLDDFKVTKVSSRLNGSCIYGTSDNKYIFFSSVVENDALEKMNNKNKYRYKLGNGILSWDVYQYIYDCDKEKIKEFFVARKDILPMLAFKFGTFIYPYHSEKTNFLIFYGQAIKKYDGKMLIISKERIIRKFKNE